MPRPAGPAAPAGPGRASPVQEFVCAPADEGLAGEPQGPGQALVRPDERAGGAAPDADAVRQEPENAVEELPLPVGLALRGLDGRDVLPDDEGADDGVPSRIGEAVASTGIPGRPRP